MANPSQPTRKQNKLDNRHDTHRERQKVKHWSPEPHCLQPSMSAGRLYRIQSEYAMSQLPGRWTTCHSVPKYLLLCRLRMPPQNQRASVHPPNMQERPDMHTPADPLCKLQCTKLGQRPELPRTNQDTHPHQIDYEQPGRCPHGGSSRLNGPTCRPVRTATELCERPSDYDFRIARFRQKTRKPYLPSLRTMV